MKFNVASMVPAALLALTTLVGTTSGLVINREDSPSLNTSTGGDISSIGASSPGLNISVGGTIDPVGTPNGLPFSGSSSSSSITRRSYRKSAPYADPHSIDPIVFAGSDELCKDHKTLEDGDYYCQKVEQVIYTNVAHAGEYMEVVHMNEDTGECRFADVNRTFSGEMAPFNEPVSCHACFLLPPFIAQQD